MDMFLAGAITDNYWLQKTLNSSQQIFWNLRENFDMVNELKGQWFGYAASIEEAADGFAADDFACRNIIRDQRKVIRWAGHKSAYEDRAVREALWAKGAQSIMESMYEPVAWRPQVGNHLGHVLVIQALDEELKKFGIDHPIGTPEGKQALYTQVWRMWFDKCNKDHKQGVADMHKGLRVLYDMEPMVKSALNGQEMKKTIYFQEEADNRAYRPPADIKPIDLMRGVK